MHTPDDAIRILYLGGNPSQKEADALALPVEAEAIRDTLAANSPGDLPLAFETDVDIDGFFAALNRFSNAQILHLAGHAHRDRGLFMKRADGSATLVPGRWIAQALTEHRNIRVVVLSACATVEHAEPLKALVDCVVATTDTIGDKATVEFAKAFYGEIAKGRDVAAAYARARTYVGFNFTEGAVSQGDRYLLATREPIDARWVTIERSVIPPASALRRHLATRQRLQARPDRVEVVLAANASDWPSAVPDGAGGRPDALIFEPGSYASDQPWQRQYPLPEDEWTTAVEAVTSAAQDVRADVQAGAQVHVVARMPLSCFAILGARLELYGAAPVFHAEAQMKRRSEREWQPWGPGMTDIRPPQSAAPVFRGLRLSSAPNASVKHVAVAIAVTRAISVTDAEAVLERASATRSERRLHMIKPIAGESQRAISDVSIDQASVELQQFFDGLAGTYPNLEAAHVMYVGPGPLLARALCKVHLGRGDTFIYEYYQGHGYARVANVSKGTVAIDPKDAAHG